MKREISIHSKVNFGGIQYACHEFVNLLNSYIHVGGSMSHKGNCWNIAVAESFFKTLKVEHVYPHRFASKEEAAISIFEWIETYYNHNRRHSKRISSFVADPEQV